MKEVNKNNVYQDAQLIKKALLGDIDAEKEIENRSEKTPQLRKIYEDLNKKGALLERFESQKKFSAEKGFIKFRLKINEKKLQIKHILQWAGVAACFVLALSISLWLSQPKPNMATNSDSTLSVGEKKAVLTLADGRTVAVDSMDILLKEKDGTEISYKDGALVYNTSTKGGEVMYNELSVPMGGESFLILADGTKVWLNSWTKIRYPVNFSQNVREVYVEGGAYFDVVKSDVAFVVNTPFGKVDVLGTTFGIEAYASDSLSYTTLASGSVSFTAEGQRPMMLSSPGEQVVVSKSGNMRKRVVNIDEYIGWKDGIYVFKIKTLAEIMTQLERWYDIKVSYEPYSLKQIPFTGNLKRYDSIEILLEALSRAENIKYRVEGKNVVLYK